MKLHREIALFAAGGCIGLLVDASVVQLLVRGQGWNPYLARIVSFLLAASVTWWWNRRHTFAARSSGCSAHAEWLHWLGLMSLGALLNYGIYAALLLAFAWLHRWPALAVAGGSAVAAVLNFCVARGMLFRHARAPL